MLFAHLNDDLIGFAQEDFPGDAVGKNPPASAGLPPVQKSPHAAEERSPRAPLRPGSRAYEPRLLSLCAPESALGSRRGP